MLPLWRMLRLPVKARSSITTVRMLSLLDQGECRRPLGCNFKKSAFALLPHELVKSPGPCFGLLLGEWWTRQRRPNQQFDGSTPLQVMERGETDRLWRMIWQLREGHSG